jgi:hypothetical protein
MHLNVSTRKNGRVYLYIERNYWDKVAGKAKHTCVQSLGYLDELEKEYPDPITHFREVARQMTEEEKKAKSANVQIDMSERLVESASGAKNLGYAVALSVYHDLGLAGYLRNRSRGEGFEFNANSILILLVISRILSPGSKKKAYEERSRYFERFQFSLDDVYRALTYFDKISKDIQRFIRGNIRAKYGSDTSVVYYDVTNYYFEITKPDEMRRYGKAKQNRKKPIIQMGLAMDRDGIPIHYELFPGNKLDKETFRSVIGEVRRNYDTGRIIVVADMGVITGDNIHYLVGDRPEKPSNGYVFSFSVQGGTKAFQEYVLDGSGYADTAGNKTGADTDFKIKSRVSYRDIRVSMTSGRTEMKTIYEKQIVFWSRKYFLKARAERAEILAKAEALIADPHKYNKATSYGAAAYISNLEYDKDTGEILEAGKRLSLDTKKIREQEQYDGYYSIVTSEIDMPQLQVVDTYRGLWEIEETFKISKSDLEARPVFVRNYDHINAHFLTCFIALTILRLIQKKTDWQFSAQSIIDCMNHIQCMHEYENVYLFAFRTPLADALGQAFDIDFSMKRLRLADIKKILGDVKK